ncbi:hypothetical protein RclHR1_01240007 [Rhizophagus clarus]|uniref:Uncharacterized protein n=1 Tax=Rhizophagus clarus TaxID=94130 RepID=A0A2Z6R012_9GLOM|nr:hypothetical protein RclHR1_01240007 [Rhizophagus clarus]GES97220.1 hypothetical protein GLOIN_2v1678227 [Rhizophagus clarus]
MSSNNEILKLRNKIKLLEEKNKKLNDENSEWQNYIGKATTFSLNDSDVNHSAQLTRDIKSVQDKITNYVGNLRPKVDINFEEVNKLLHFYGCHAQVCSKENDLLQVKAVLQRHVFEVIINGAKNHESWLEGEIYNKADELLELLSKLSTSCVGANEINRALPIKIRQQIYGLLGSLGLANNTEDKNEEHPIIVGIKNKLNETINKLRTIKDPNKSSKHDDMATNLIQELIRIYFFRLQVQEPAVRTIWFKYDDNIDPNLMEGRWDDEDTDEDKDNNPLVLLCSFPLFVANYGEQGQKIYSRAKIIHHFKQVRQEQVEQDEQVEQVEHVGQVEQVEPVEGSNRGGNPGDSSQSGNPRGGDPEGNSSENNDENPGGNRDENPDSSQSGNLESNQYKNPGWQSSVNVNSRNRTVYRGSHSN